MTTKRQRQKPEAITKSKSRTKAKAKAKAKCGGSSLRSEAVTKLVSQGSGAVRIGVGLVGWTGQRAGLGVF
jgi:hypothetical protein